jgi:hypothetical protein
MRAANNLNYKESRIKNTMNTLQTKHSPPTAGCRGVCRAGQANLLLLPLTILVVCGHTPESVALQLSPDEFFVVAGKNLLGLSAIGTPSVNDNGDIVARVTTISGTEHRVFLFSDQIDHPSSQGTIPSVAVRSSPNTLASLPVINNHTSIVSHLSFSQGNQNIYRFDYDGTSFIGTLMAQAQAGGAQPFRVLGSIAAIDDETNLYFYGETLRSGQTQNDKRIYVATNHITQPDNAVTIARLPDNFSTLDQYVAASANGNVVYRGTKSGDLGIYKENANLPVATSSLGFSTTGNRPSINSLNTVGFYGVYTKSLVPQLPGVFLQLNGEAAPRFPGNFAAIIVNDDDILVPYGEVPSTFSSGDRVALNDYNQVAFLGTDASGHQAIFTTALGRMRKLAAVGDYIVFQGQKKLTGLALFNGMGTKGQVVFLANTSDGDQLVLVANRAFNQRSTLYSPIIPSYHDTQYLRHHESDPEFPACAECTIGWIGCNLTSTVNLLNCFGAFTSPLEFQNWLISRWRAESLQRRVDYISDDNDFSDGVLEEYSQYLFSRGETGTIVQFRGTHSVTRGSNLGTIISELRSGRAVKLRAPSRTRFGHFILAYGIIDPSKTDAQITSSDILIADPGKYADFTLAGYGQIAKSGTSETYDQYYGQNWLEDEQSVDGRTYRRVYLYDTVQHRTLSLSAYSPIEMILTDAQGRRAGYTSATGLLTEIPGSDCYAETSYYTLDDEGVTSEPAWGTDEPVKQIFVDGVTNGAFTLNILGTSNGTYTVSMRANGGLDSDIHSVTGTINPGETRTVVFNLQTIKPKFLDPQTGTSGIISWTVVGDPMKPISVETSSDMSHWSKLPGPQITNGVGTVSLTITNGPSQRFLRAYE